MPDGAGRIHSLSVTERAVQRFDFARSPALVEYSEFLGSLTPKRPEGRGPTSRQLANALPGAGCLTQPPAVLPSPRETRFLGPIRRTSASTTHWKTWALTETLETIPGRGAATSAIEFVCTRQFLIANNRPAQHAAGGRERGRE